MTKYELQVRVTITNGSTKFLFWSISIKESLESQQKHALRNRVLQAVFCSNDNFNPGYNREMVNRKSTSILDKSCFIMNSCFIQYISPLVKNVNVARKINTFCQEWLVFCKLWIHLNVFEVEIVSVTVHDNIEIFEVYTYFYQYILSILGKNFPIWNPSFHCPAIVAFQLQLVLVFLEKFLELDVQHIKSQFWIYVEKEIFLSPMFQLILNRIERTTITTKKV